MGAFVKGGSMPIDRLEKRLGRRHLYEVLRGYVEGAIASDAKVDAARLDKRRHLGLDQARLGRWSGDSDIVGKPLALQSVEDREPLQERNGLRILAGLAGASLLVVGDEPVGINDSGAVFAAPYMAAKRQRLAESQPALAGITVLDDSAPENEHVDAGVAAPRGGVLRHGERRLRRGRTPRLDPRQPPSVQLADDLCGDLVIQASAARAGLVAVLGHRGSPRRVPGASLPALNPSRKTRSALSLSGYTGARDGSPKREDPAAGASALPTARPSGRRPQGMRSNHGCRCGTRFISYWGPRGWSRRGYGSDPPGSPGSSRICRSPSRLGSMPSPARVCR